MKSVLHQVVSSPFGALVVLIVAASLEVLGDSFFQSGLYRSSGTNRAMWFALGVAALVYMGGASTCRSGTLAGCWEHMWRCFLWWRR